jgi:hypothetical protein
VIAGLSLGAWVLIVTSVGLGLAIEVAVFVKFRQEREP